MKLCIMRRVSMTQEETSTRATLTHITLLANMVGLRTLIGSSPINGIMILCIMRHVSMKQVVTL